MKVKYFVESAYNDLFDTITKNADLYYSANGDWVAKNFKDAKFCKESRIDVHLPTLDAKDDEFTNVLAIHNAFKDILRNNKIRQEQEFFIA